MSSASPLTSLRALRLSHGIHIDTLGGWEVGKFICRADLIPFPESLTPATAAKSQAGPVQVRAGATSRRTLSGFRRDQFLLRPSGLSLSRCCLPGSPHLWSADTQTFSLILKHQAVTSAR